MNKLTSTLYVKSKNIEESIAFQKRLYSLGFATYLGKNDKPIKSRVLCIALPPKDRIEEKPIILKTDLTPAKKYHLVAYAPFRRGGFIKHKREKIGWLKPEQVLKFFAFIGVMKICYS